VDSLVPAGEHRRLGSIELLPVDLLFQPRLPTGGRVHPDAGAGPRSSSGPTSISPRPRCSTQTSSGTAWRRISRPPGRRSRGSRSIGR